VVWIEMEIKCQMINGEEKIVSLTMGENSKLVEKVDCRFFKKGEDKFSCNIATNDSKKCLFDELNTYQLELYKKSNSFIQSMMGRCYNCNDLTVSSLVEEEYLKEIPEGLSCGQTYCNNVIITKLRLCSPCDNKMDKEIVDIHKKYGAKD